MTQCSKKKLKNDKDTVTTEGSTSDSRKGNQEGFLEELLLAMSHEKWIETVQMEKE